MAPSKLTDIFLRERCEKDIQFIKIYDQYSPNYNKTTTTPKFYAKHEAGDGTEAHPELLKNLIRANDMAPRQKREWPETVNQIYGWWPNPLVDMDRNDSRFYFPRPGTEITKHGLQMKSSKDPRK